MQPDREAGMQACSEAGRPVESQAGLQKDPQLGIRKAGRPAESRQGWQVRGRVDGRADRKANRSKAGQQPSKAGWQACIQPRQAEMHAGRAADKQAAWQAGKTIFRHADKQASRDRNAEGHMTMCQMG